MIKIRRTPKALEWYFNQAVWSSPNNKIWLTFDDGPDPNWTLKFANLLAENETKGVFFVVGERIKDIQLLTELDNLGHDIAWHGNNHCSFLRLGRKELLFQFNSKNKYEDILGKPFKYFRFPYGYFLPYMLKIVNSMEMLPMFWSYMIHDYKTLSVDYMYKLLIKTRSTDILLLHDHSPNSKNTFQALKLFLNETQLQLRNL